MLFTAALAVLGVSLFATIVGLAATAIVEGRVSLFSRSRRMERRIDQMSEHFIVCAYAGWADQSNASSQPSTCRS
jgi:hypothetical protein